jgi:hypothetical protein
MKDENKRTYRRTTTLLPFQVRRLQPGDSKDLQSRVSRDSIVIDASPPPALDDESLLVWLNMLNNKLDYLIRLLSPDREDFVFMAFEPLNISGSGMRLNSTERFTLGDVLEIRIVLETCPSKVLYLFGEVVRMESLAARPGTYTVGIRFIGMNEEVCNEIVKFDFKKHREKLLKKKTS